MSGAFDGVFDACEQGRHAECAGEKTCTSERRGGALEVKYCECPCLHNGEGLPERIDLNDPYTDLGEAGA